MIVSVSRRTDIPAFYPDWFFRRLEEKYVYVRNPMNPRQVSEPGFGGLFCVLDKESRAYDGPAIRAG